MTIISQKILGNMKNSVDKKCREKYSQQIFCCPYNKFIRYIYSLQRYATSANFFLSLRITLCARIRVFLNAAENIPWCSTLTVVGNLIDCEEVIDVHERARPFKLDRFIKKSEEASYFISVFPPLVERPSYFSFNQGSSSRHVSAVVVTRLARQTHIRAYIYMYICTYSGVNIEAAATNFVNKFLCKIFKIFCPVNNKKKSTRVAYREICLQKSTRQPRLMNSRCTAPPG